MVSEVTTGRDLDHEFRSPHGYLGRMFGVELMARAKALRLEQPWHVQGMEKRSVWLERRDSGKCGWGGPARSSGRKWICPRPGHLGKDWAQAFNAHLLKEHTRADLRILS